MGYLMAGVIISLAALGGLKLSLPTADGQLRSFLKNGTDTWVAVVITVGAALGIGALVVGIVEIAG